MNGDPFELALALVKYGFQVAEIYGTLTAENFVYLNHLSELSPQTKVFSNMEPTMIYYDHERERSNHYHWKRCLLLSSGCGKCDVE